MARSPRSGTGTSHSGRRVRGSLRSMFAVRVVGAALVLSLGLTACRTPATQVNLEIGSSCGRIEDRSVRLVVSDGTGSVVREETSPVTSWPIRQTLVPRGGDATRRWRVEVTLLDARGVVVLDDTQVLEGGYTSAASVPVAVTVRDPACEDAGARDGGSDADLEPPDDAPEGMDGGTRAVSGLLLAYPFDETAGSTVRECVAGASVTMDAGADFTWDGGLVLRSGWGRSPALPTEILEGMLDAFSVEGWIEIDPSLALPESAENAPSHLRVLGFYDTASFYNPLRVSLAGGVLDPLYADAAVALDAGERVTDARFVELLGGVTTDRTGDSYARPLFAARAPRTGPLHFVYVYEGGPSTGTDRLYVGGAMQREARWIRPPMGVYQPPRIGVALVSNPVTRVVRTTTRIYLGNHPNYGDVGMGAFESPPTSATQFAGTYHLLAFYGRALTPAEVAHHAALGPSANPCPP